MINKLSEPIQFRNGDTFSGDSISSEYEWKKKVWGATRLVAKGFNFEVHELKVNKGGYCSRHRHEKWNSFQITEGVMEVEHLGAGDSPVESGGLIFQITAYDSSLDVEPGTWHRFNAITDCHLIEVYWADTTDGLLKHCDPNDIERFDEGGISP